MSLSQFGLGFWQAWWTYALCTNDLFDPLSSMLPDNLPAYVNPSLALLLSTTLGYLAIALNGARVQKLRDQRGALPVIAAACLLGTLAMGGASHVVHGEIPMVALSVFVLGMLVFSAGNALLVAFWGMRWSSLASGSVGRYLYMSYLVAIAAFVALFPLPPAARVPIAACLPALSLFILHESRQEPERKASPVLFEQDRPILSRPLVATFVLNVSWGAGLPCLLLVAGSAGQALPGLLAAAVCLAALIAHMTRAQPATEAFAVARPVCLSLLAGMLSPFVIPDNLSFIGYGLTTLGGACLDMLVMLVACDMAFRLDRPVASVLGWAMVTSRAGSLAGRFLYDGLASGNSAWAERMLVACALGAAFCGLVIFDRADLQALYRTRPILPRAETVNDRCNALARQIGLTQRETQIAQLLARGRSAPFIARELGISTGTVKNYVSGIYRKAGVGDRQDLLSAIDQIRSEQGET